VSAEATAEAQVHSSTGEVTGGWWLAADVLACDNYATVY